MSRPKNLIPRARKHKASGQAVVTIDGRDHYLGLVGEHSTMIKYRRMIGDLAYEDAHREIQKHISNLELKRKEILQIIDEANYQALQLEKNIDLLRLRADLYMLQDQKYPDPPSPVGNVGAFNLPEISCIYFLHNTRGIEYVGKTIDLKKRFGIAGARHHAARSGDAISWIEFPSNNLEFIECYYIWLTKPIRNFGNDNVF